MSSLTVFMLVLGIALVAAVALYNKLVRQKNAVTNSFAQIDVQLKRRYDLIPNLVEVAKKYVQHERETLEAVTSARNQAASAAKTAKADPGSIATLAALNTAEASLGGALSRLMAVVEAYPDLKADASLGRLHEELTSTEGRIGFARQGFNDAVLDYNNTAEQFPGNIIAGIFRFKSAAMLESTTSQEERQAVKVSL